MKIEKEVKTWDDLQLFCVLSQSMELTSCHVRLALMFHNASLLTVEAGRNPLKRVETVLQYSELFGVLLALFLGQLKDPLK